MMQIVLFGHPVFENNRREKYTRIYATVRFNVIHCLLIAEPFNLKRAAFYFSYIMLNTKKIIQAFQHNLFFLHFVWILLLFLWQIYMI